MKPSMPKVRNKKTHGEPAKGTNKRMVGMPSLYRAVEAVDTLQKYPTLMQTNLQSKRTKIIIGIICSFVLFHLLYLLMTIYIV